MSNQTSNIVTNLKSATYWINFIIPVLHVIFGAIGNLLNLIIFSRRSLRINPCSLYFLIGSINNFVVIYAFGFARYLANIWNLDPSATNIVLCKLRIYLGYVSFSLVLWFLALASVDRFLSSSHNAGHRRLSSLSNSRKIIAIITILALLLYVHILILFAPFPNGNVYACKSIFYEYTVFLSLFFLLLSVFLPLILMSIFSILTIINVRKIRTRIVPQNNNSRNDRLQPHDRQLVVMLLVQVLITTLFATPYAILSTWSTFALSIFKYNLTTFQQALYNFWFEFARLLSFTNPVIGFCIYSLTGSKFRTEMKQCIKYVLKFILNSIGLMRYMPLRVQQALHNVNQMDSNHDTAIQNRRGNAIQRQRTIILSTAL